MQISQLAHNKQLVRCNSSDLWRGRSGTAAAEGAEAAGRQRGAPGAQEPGHGGAALPRREERV